MATRCSRRSFIKLGAAGGAALFLPWGFAPGMAVAQIPGGTLDPRAIPKYRTPLLVPPAMPRAAKLKMRGGKSVDYYEIAVRQFEQQILPAGLPATTVWGYGPRVAQGGGPLIFNAPSLTIEAKNGTPVRVKWVNELREDPTDPSSAFLPHLLPVDPTLHWANPPGGEVARDSRPDFGSTPGPYTGPVPVVTHVHGSAGVGDESDGYAEAWYLRTGGQHSRPASPPKAPGTTSSRARPRARGYLAPGTDAWEPGDGRLPVPEQPARVDDLVPRPHARHDPPERLRRTGGLLPDPRWARRRGPR